MVILVCFQWVQQSIRNVTDDITNHQLLYVTHDDICGSFEGDTLLAIQGPNGTQLEVPRPELSTVPGQKNRYQIHLKSSEGQIYVLLVNKDQDSEQPVVVQVTNLTSDSCRASFGWVFSVRYREQRILICLAKIRLWFTTISKPVQFLWTLLGPLTPWWRGNQVRLRNARGMLYYRTRVFKR